MENLICAKLIAILGNGVTFPCEESMPLDLHAKGCAPARNIQIEPNLTKQKCYFVCYGHVQTLWHVDPMACEACD